MLPTRTVTLPKMDGIQVRSLAFPSALFAHVHNLFVIVQDHQHQPPPHPLSSELLTRAAALCSLVLYAFEETPVFFEKIVGQMQALKQLLRNSLDNAPLSDPVLANGYVWERWMHDHCRQLGMQSPFDFTPLEPFQPYTLAAGMLAWKQTLLESSDPYIAVLAAHLKTVDDQEDPSRWLNRSEVEALSRQEAICGYMHLAQQSLRASAWPSEQLLLLARQTSRYCHYIETTAAHNIEQQIALTEQRLGTTERLFIQETQQIRHTYQRGIAAVEREREALRVENQALVQVVQRQEEVQEQLTQTVQDLTLRMEGLRQQLGQLAHQNERNAQAAQRTHRTTTVICAIM